MQTLGEHAKLLSQQPDPWSYELAMLPAVPPCNPLLQHMNLRNSACQCTQPFLAIFPRKTFHYPV